MRYPMMFEAGRIASQRGWKSPEIVQALEVGGMSPTGPPAIVLGKAGDLDTSTVRALAALAGAGRDIILITEQPLTDEMAAWLPPNMHHVLGDSLDLHFGLGDAPPALSDDVEATSIPATSVGQFVYCTFQGESALDGLEPARDGWVLEAWTEFVRRHALSVQDQERGDQVSAGSWRLDDDGPVAPLWFQPMRRTDDSSEFILIGSTIGIVEKPGTAVDDSDWQQRFADQVVSWCEQPGATAMLSRVMGQFAEQTAPLGQRKTADECFNVTSKGGASPQRVLITENSDQVLVWTSPTDSALIPISAAGRTLTFIYRVPAYRAAENLDDVLCHAIDSLVRIQELLGDPATTLDGRRDSRLADPLEQFLRNCGLVTYAALARMALARETSQDGGIAMPDGRDLLRMSAILSETIRTLGANPDPQWLPLLEYGDIGFPAAVRHHEKGEWPKPRERAAIGEVYRVLCQSLSLDAESAWASFQDMLDANIAAQHNPPPEPGPVVFHSQDAEASPGVATQRGPIGGVCGNCGTQAVTGDRFCATCGSAL